MKKVTIKELQKSIDNYNIIKGPFRRYFPWFENSWPKVSFGMRRLIVFTQKIEKQISADKDLLATSFSTELYQIINTLSERDQRNKTGGIFAPISRLINSPNIRAKKTVRRDDESSQSTSDKPADPEPEQKKDNAETVVATNMSSSAVDLIALSIGAVPLIPVIVDTSDDKPGTTPPASTPTILQIMQDSFPLEKHHSPLTETGSAPPAIARPHLQHSHSQPGDELNPHQRKARQHHKKPVIMASVSTSTDDLTPDIVLIAQAPQPHRNPDYANRLSRAGIFGVAMGYVGMVDSLEEGNISGAMTYGGLTGLIYAAVAYQTDNNTSLIGMVSVLLSVITFNWWPPRIVAHALAAVGVSAAVNFRTR